MYNKDQREIPYFDELLPRYKVHPPGECEKYSPAERGGSYRGHIGNL